MFFLGVGLLILAAWVIPKPIDLDVFFFQRYEPRSMVAVLLFVVGLAGCGLAVRQLR